MTSVVTLQPEVLGAKETLCSGNLPSSLGSDFSSTSLSGAIFTQKSWRFVLGDQGWGKVAAPGLPLALALTLQAHLPFFRTHRVSTCWKPVQTFIFMKCSSLYEVQLALKQLGGWSTCNLWSAFCTHSSYTSMDSTHSRPCSAVILLWKNIHIWVDSCSLNPTLFKGQLNLLWGRCYARQKSTGPQSSRACGHGLLFAVWLPWVTALPPRRADPDGGKKHSHGCESLFLNCLFSM